MVPLRLRFGDFMNGEWGIEICYEIVQVMKTRYGF